MLPPHITLQGRHFSPTWRVRKPRPGQDPLCPPQTILPLPPQHRVVRGGFRPGGLGRTPPLLGKLLTLSPHSRTWH